MVNLVYIHLLAFCEVTENENNFRGFGFWENAFKSGGLLEYEMMSTVNATM